MLNRMLESEGAQHEGSWHGRSDGAKRVSYVLTTLNKVSFLKETLKRYAEALGDEEELLIVDGGSRDGSAEHIHEWFEQGKVSAYVSEPDLCEAHALNKALLMAQGRYITILTDDDVFDFGVLRQLHRYLDENPDISVAFPSGADTQWDEEPFVRPTIDILLVPGLIENRDAMFPYSGLGLTIRRADLPKLGLFDLNFKRVDVAYFCRLTTLPIKLVGSALFGFVRILNSKSATVTMGDRNYEELKRLTEFYGGGGYMSGRRLLAEALKRVRERFVTASQSPGNRSAVTLAASATDLSPAEQVRIAEDWLKTANADRLNIFVRRG